METLGARIRKIRKQAGIGTEAFGEKLGVKSGAVYKYERNGAEPSVAALKTLSRIGGISIDELVTGEPCSVVCENSAEHEAKHNAEDAAFLDLLHQLSPGKKELAKMVLKDFVAADKHRG